MLTPTTAAPSFCKPWRIAAAALLLLGCSSPAFAKPRLVRVIWDVGQNAVYYKNYLRTEQGHDMFAVPRNAAEAGADGFMRQTVTTPVLRQGARVRVYVV